MMKINKPALQEELKKTKSLSWRAKLILTLLILLVLVSAAFYYYFSTTRAKLLEAKQTQSTYQTLQEEITRCNQIISEGQGEFSQYEYCTRLLNTFK